jgi:hypothetical protein
MQYKFISDARVSYPVSLVRTNDDGSQSSIPYSLDNTDYVQFLKDWEAGAEVLNADGSPATYSDDAVRALGLEP